MSIDNSTVKKVAILARIEVKKDEEDKLIHELNNILGWVDELKKVNTENVNPMLSVFNESMIMRDDESKSNFKTDEILQNSPKNITGFFVVPKVVE